MNLNYQRYGYDEKDPLFSKLAAETQAVARLQIEKANDGDANCQFCAGLGFEFSNNHYRTLYALPNLVKCIYWFRRVLADHSEAEDPEVRELVNRANDHLIDNASQLYMNVRDLRDKKWDEIEPTLLEIQNWFENRLNWRALYVPSAGMYALNIYGAAIPDNHHWLVARRAKGVVGG